MEYARAFETKLNIILSTILIIIVPFAQISLMQMAIWLIRTLKSSCSNCFRILQIGQGDLNNEKQTSDQAQALQHQATTYTSRNSLWELHSVSLTTFSKSSLNRMNSLLMIYQFMTIFLAILAYSSLLALSSSYYYGNPFYAFAQTTRRADLCSTSRKYTIRCGQSNRL